MTLSNKHQAFIDNYFLCNFNATEAYMRTYNSKKRTTAGVNGHELLKNPNISEAIAARIAENTMSADEALLLLSDMARGDVGKLMDVSSMGFDMNMQKAKDQGLTKLIKKVKQRTIIHQGKSESDEDREVHDIELELHDPQAALDKILKAHGRYVEKVEVESKGEIIIRYADSDNTPDPT